MDETRFALYGKTWVRNFSVPRGTDWEDVKRRANAEIPAGNEEDVVLYSMFQGIDEIWGQRKWDGVRLNPWK